MSRNTCVRRPRDSCCKAELEKELELHPLSTVLGAAATGEIVRSLLFSESRRLCSALRCVVESADAYCREELSQSALLSDIYKDATR